MSTAALPCHSPASTTLWQKLAWRFLHHGRWSLAGALLIVCGIPSALYSWIGMVDVVVVSNMTEDLVALQRLFFMMEIGVFPILLMFEAINIRPLYTLPMMTSQIVHRQLVIAVAVMVGLHLVTVAYYAVFFGATIPVLGPLLFLIPGVVIAAGLTALLVDFGWWRPLVAMGVAWLLLWQSVMRFTDPIVLNRPNGWITPTPGECGLLWGLSIAGYFIALNTAGRDRRGDTTSWLVLEEWLQRQIAQLGGLFSQRQRMTSFASPMAAQLATQWRTRGLILPIIVTAFAMLSLIAAWFDPREWLRGYVASLSFLPAVALGFNGYFIGLMFEDPKRMDRFEATRPLTDAQLATAKLRCGLLSTLVALLISFVLFVLVHLFAWMSGLATAEIWNGFLDEMHRSKQGSVATYIGTCVAIGLLGWAAFGVNLASVVSGRNWTALTLVFVFIGGMMLNGLLVQQWQSGKLPGLEHHFGTLEQLQLLIGACLGAMLVMAALISFWLARVKRLITAKTIGVALALWMASMTILTMMFIHWLGLMWAPPELGGMAFAIEPAGQQWRELGLGNLVELLVFIAGLAALVALPLASVPLAIHWNRHR